MYKNYKEFLNERDNYLRESQQKSSSSGAKHKPKNKTALEKLVADNNINLGDIDISNVKNLSGLFNQTKRTDFSGIENWDVSHVTNMSGMFANCPNFNEPIGNWDVSNVEDMSYMFDGAKKFNQPLNNWDVGNVLFMDAMFRDAESFNKPLNSWDTKKVRSMAAMFRNAKNFNQPLDKWNVDRTDVDGMFIGAKAFDQDKTINIWKEKYPKIHHSRLFMTGLPI